MSYARSFAALCLTLMLAACAGSDDAASDTAAPADAYNPSTMPAPTPTATNDTAGIEVVLTEWSVVVNQGIVSPGTFTFRGTNQGSYAHAFEIEGNGKEWKTDPIPPGSTATLTPTLTAGTYTVYCPITDSHGDHQEKGMSTTFRVQ